MPPKSRPRKEVERPLSARPMGFVRNAWYLSLKSAVDSVLALVLLAFASPIILLAAVLVKLTSRGPAFYTQTRVGQYGQHFTIVKLRTMVENCESLTGPRWAIPGDPRVTLLGQVLRVTHLDELPQLLNVLRGDMSIIGPRPERPEFLPNLERQLPGYRDRLLVKPGVTGLAQVQLPADTDIESVRRKLSLDLWYVENVSPWLDLRILLCTGFYILGVPFRIGGKLCAVPSANFADSSPETTLPETVRARARVAA
ncbi:MAG: sugar transferase [Planctomycetia bacterium]|nr:sugar transferase [Planctomycetia bacterium]